MPVKVDIVTAEKVVYSDTVDMVVAPGIEGELGVLPRHTPLITMLNPGELRLKKGSEEICMAVSGGFLEVRPDRIIILADTAERSDEIDIARAEAARESAKKLLAAGHAREPNLDQAQAEASLRRALVRLKVAQRRKPRI